MSSEPPEPEAEADADAEAPIADEERPQIDVLYEDEHVVVANKPGGLLVHRSRASTDKVFLLQELGALTGRYLYPVHRLDRAASGAIAMACSSDDARELQRALSADDAVKEYLVLVRGEIAPSGHTDRPLTDHPRGVKKSAFTSWERVATFSRCSLLRARIRTGRHRQIRRHFAHLAHQVIGCTHHGKGRINQYFRDEYGLPRLFLHAARLDVEHPAGDGRRLAVVAPLAPDLRAFLARLPDLPDGLLDTL